MQFLKHPEQIPQRQVPLQRPWRWSDDTHMALSIVEELFEGRQIEQDRLAQRFAHRYAAEPWRGYRFGARELLRTLQAGQDWRQAASTLFGGTGSWGNGGAMRAGPIGAWFAGDPLRAAHEGRRSAEITHAHPEGQEGAAAVAVATCLAAAENPPAGVDFLHAVLSFLQPGRVREGIEQALTIPAAELQRAIDTLGTGQQISAADTVPFCLWVSAHHLQDYEEALWTTITGGNDGDTTCAIVGSIVVMASAPIPEAWLAAREPLPPLQ